MQACCDLAFKYAHEREQFGQKIGTFQVAFILYETGFPFKLIILFVTGKIKNFML